MENSINTAFIYIDEYGTPDLDITKAGNEDYFIYTAFIISKENLNLAYSVYSKIIHEEFSQQSYIKSNKIKKDKNGYLKTLNVLTILNNLEHYVYALIIDKKELNKDSGLVYKSVFIKYFQKIISKHFLKTYPEFHIYADETGWPAFKESLQNYMESYVGLEATLFSKNDIHYCNDKDEELIQFADFYAGILGRYYCGKYDNNEANIIHNIIKTRLSIEWFPENTISIIASLSEFESNFDLNLFKASIETAKQYIEHYPHDSVGCGLINYIIQEALRKPQRCISSKEIRNALTSQKIEISDPIVKISDLRDKGVVIISPLSMKGYKFPTNKQEIADFFRRLSSNVIPQIRRGYILNKTINEKLFGDCNILNDNNFTLLNQICGIVNK